MGNRMSSLPIARICAKAPALSSISATEAAAQSSAFHALSSGDPKGMEMLARLSDEQRDELLAWKRPTTCILGDGVVLEYDAAVKEVEVGLNADGEYCFPSDPACISIGHLDFAWVVEVNGVKCAYVGDLKRTEWTATDGPRSLQLMAYMLAWASRHDCEMGCAGIWSLVDGSWTWGEMIDLGMFSEEAEKLRSQVVAAAMNVDGGYITGAHCFGCYGRSHCPAHLMPPELATTELAPFVEPGALLQLSSDERGKLKLMIQRAKDTIEKADAALKAAAKQGHAITCDGKQYKVIQSKGREGLDTKRLEAEMPEIADRYRTVGKPFDTFRWVNQ